MNNSYLPRRTFLRGAAGAMLGLPLLDVMEPRSARGAAKSVAPTRLGCIYMPNGIPKDAWEPETVNGRISKNERVDEQLSAAPRQGSISSGPAERYEGEPSRCERDLARPSAARRRSRLAHEERGGRPPWTKLSHVPLAIKHLSLRWSLLRSPRGHTARTPSATISLGATQRRRCRVSHSPAPCMIA